MSRLKKLRLARQMTQINLASEIGSSQSVISKLERGEQVLSADEIIAYSQYFSVSVEYILCISDYMRTPLLNTYLNQKMEKYIDLVYMLDNLKDSDRETIFVLAKHLCTRSKAGDFL